MDPWSRKFVAWSNRRAQPRLISHFDGGSQYCSHSFKEQLAQKGYLQSMGSTGNRYTKAFMESYLVTPKTELIRHKRYETRDETRRSIFEYI
jgi:putative transposase